MELKAFLTLSNTIALISLLTISSNACAVEFNETFDAESALQRFDFAVHHPVLFFEPLRSWQGDHSDACGPPSTTRTIQLPGNRSPGDGKTYDLDTGDAVYWCAPGGPQTGHLMTSFKTRGYAQIDFSPKFIFEGVSKVCWDQNMTDLGVRKWTQVVVVAINTFESNNRRMDYVTPALDDGPASLATMLEDDGDTFLLEVHGGSSRVYTGRSGNANWRGYVNADKVRRFTTCVTDLENGTVEIEFERESSVEKRIQPGAMPNGPVRVIFQDDTYNAPKSPPKLDVPDPFTWHWDNIRIISASSKPYPNDDVTPERNDVFMSPIYMLLFDSD